MITRQTQKKNKKRRKSREEPKTEWQMINLPPATLNLHSQVDMSPSEHHLLFLLAVPLLLMVVMLPLLLLLLLWLLVRMCLHIKSGGRWVVSNRWEQRGGISFLMLVLLLLLCLLLGRVVIE
jgi:hypothetical protein